MIIVCHGIAAPFLRVRAMVDIEQSVSHVMTNGPIGLTKSFAMYKIIYIAMMLFMSDPVVPYPSEAGIATEKVIAAHRYHGLDHHNNGVQFSIEDDGKEYFYRNGQRCRLFTDAFLKKWGRHDIL